MNLMRKFWDFLKSFFILENESIQNELDFHALEEFSEENIEKEDRISAAKRTLMSKLYSIEQDITLFENDFPEKYKIFMEKIAELRSTYNSSLKNKDELLTFEIDPELDFQKIGEIVKLEKDVRNFIETEVKFDIISKRLQRLIIKLNILYNTSIFYSGENEKKKVISQLERALISETKIVKELKECYYILSDNQLKERIVNLLSYIDYQIFKTSIRNSNNTSNNLTEKLVMLVEFVDFDYVTAFKDFIKDEISDLNELMPLVSDENCRKVLEKKVKKLLTNLTYSEDIQSQIFDIEFWNTFFNVESSLFELLRASGVEKEKAKVRLIDRMNISLDESEVLVSPRTSAYLELANLFSKTHDEKILPVIKLLKNISDEVTYKEIYFLIVLFDVIQVINNIPNDLLRHIEKYLEKYQYNRTTINEKKDQVMYSSNKEYVFVFTLNDYEENIITTLENLNFDFKISNDNIFINSFYFNGLENVLNSLKHNTNKILTT